MSKHYHVTLTQGRADTLTLESDSKGDILTLLNSVSTAKVKNIKKIVYSKDLQINYTNSIFQSVGFYKQVNIFVTAKGQAKTFQLRHIKKTVTKQHLIDMFKKYVLVNGNNIEDVYSIIFYNK